MIGSHYIQNIALSVAGKPENLQTAVRRTLAGIDPNLTVLDMMSLREQFDLNFNQDRLIARLTELFGFLALVLACVGLYGVTAYSVARPTNEIGIRMALGADRGNVLGLVLRGAMLQLGFGLAVGIPVALAQKSSEASIICRLTLDLETPTASVISGAGAPIPQKRQRDTFEIFWRRPTLLDCKTQVKLFSWRIGGFLACGKPD